MDHGDDDLEVEMIEVEGPESWTELFCRVVLFFQILFIALLVLIYVAQEMLLYIPNEPVKYIRDNPVRYRDPSVRGMTHDEIWLKTSDNIKL